MQRFITLFFDFSIDKLESLNASCEDLVQDLFLGFIEMEKFESNFKEVSTEILSEKTKWKNSKS